MMISTDILKYHCLSHLRLKSDKFNFIMISCMNNYEYWDENIFLLIQNFNTQSAGETQLSIQVMMTLRSWMKLPRGMFILKR